MKQGQAITSPVIPMIRILSDLSSVIHMVSDEIYSGKKCQIILPGGLAKLWDLLNKE